jgi:hypothetical protein
MVVSRSGTMTNVEEERALRRGAEPLRAWMLGAD